MHRLPHLKHKVVFSLQLEVQYGLLDIFLEVQVPFTGYIQSREQVSNETHEDGHVICHYLGYVKVSQSPHQHLILRSPWITSLQRAGYNQHRLNGSQSPVVVVLRHTNGSEETIFNTAHDVL